MRLHLPDGRPFLIVAVMLAAYVVSVVLVPPRVVPPSIALTVTATGLKNPASQGTEAWVLDAPGLNAGVNVPGWERRDHALVSYRNQPAQLAWDVPIRSTRALKLMTHPFSGIVKIRVGDVERTFDLFSVESGSVDVRIGQMVAESQGISRRSLISLGVLAVLLAAAAWMYRRWFVWPHSRQALFVFASAMVAAHILLGNMQEIGLRGIAFTFGWFLFVVWVELLVIKQIARRLAGWTEAALLSAAFVVNAYCTFFVSSQTGAIAFWGGIAGATLIFGLAVSVGDQSIGRRVCYVFCGSFAGLAMAGAILSAPAVAVADNLARPATAASKSADRPNIYFLSFDGVPSRSAFRPLFGADTRLWTVLEKNGFSVCDAKSPGQYTLQTFYRVFTLQDSASPSFDFMLGYDESPVLDRLKSAGYRVQSIQGSSYFGILNSRWDYSYPDRQSVFDYCWSVQQRNVFFFGVCNVFSVLRWDVPSRQLAKVEERVIVAAASDAPWFTFAHVLSPGHTAPGYAHDDSRQRTRFITKYLEDLEDMSRPLESLLVTINEHDPNAVVIFHSDHGPWVTRGWPVIGVSADRAALREMDLSSVPLAVRPAGFCSGPLDRISTTADVLPAIFDYLGF